MLLDRAFDVSTNAVSPADDSLEMSRKVERFLFNESALLDERLFEEWLALWTDDGRYWVPRHHGQTDPFGEISLFWEDRMLRETRVRRLLNARNWSQQPPTQSSRLIGNVQVMGVDSQGLLVVRSKLHVDEFRREARYLAGTVMHKLDVSGGSWKIHLKRIDLVNCDDVFGNLEVFL